MVREYLGRGWSFPPTFVRERAAVAMLEEEADIASSLEILLSTTPGERIMQPFYGCDLSELLFETLDTRMKTLMVDKVESSILYHEARIILDEAPWICTYHLISKVLLRKEVKGIRENATSLDTGTEYPQVEFMNVEVE